MYVRVMVASRVDSEQRKSLTCCSHVLVFFLPFRDVTFRHNVSLLYSFSKGNKENEAAEKETTEAENKDARKISYTTPG